MIQCKCCGKASEALLCSKDCKKRVRNLTKISRSLSGEQVHINQVLSIRWELLNRLAPVQFRDLMYEIERHYPLSLKP